MNLNDLSMKFLECKDEDYQNVFWSIVNYDYKYEVDDELLKEIKSNCENPDYLADVIEPLIDVYTSDLLKWYNDDLSRISYANNYIQEFSPTNLFEILQGGQMLYYQELANRVANDLLEFLEEIKV